MGSDPITQVKKVTNTKGEPVVDGVNIDKRFYEILYVADYVRYRLNRLDNLTTALSLEIDEDRSGRLIFHSPLSLKYRGVMEESFDTAALFAAIERRLYILNCFEGRQEDKDYQRISVEGCLPELAGQKVFHETVRRYSGTKQSKVIFNGIRGWCDLNGINKDALVLLLAGELIHIGKNTSFGFGRYTFMEEG